LTDAARQTEPHVVILGGGFAGLNAAAGLRSAPARVTVVDRRNFHLFQPLLYQVATGGLSPAEITSPLRSVLKRQRNTTVIQAVVVDLDPAGRRVILADGAIEYDVLLLATGVEHHYFGHDDWQRHAPGLKTVEDALEMRSRVLSAFERAERTTDPAERRRLLSFVVVGGGPTGVELAGAIGELARHTLRGEFRGIEPAAASIVLVELGPRILSTYPPTLARAAERSLERLGVSVRTGTAVSAIDGEGVTVRRDDVDERLRAATVLWAAGVRPTPFARILADKAGAQLDRSGRVLVAPDLSVPGHPEIFVLGDLTHVAGPDGQPVPAIAPAAMQMGRYAARAIRARLRGESPRPFRYRDKGTLAVIGRAAAVADLGRLRFSGYPAWLLWLFIHILYLVEFENRVLVFVQWAFSYFTRRRGARLITP
jgi:NADH:ubiquinone reductase (H+-translocating)